MGVRARQKGLKESGKFVSDRAKLLLKLAVPFLGDNLPKMEYGAYTLLKILCVNYYAGIFTRIAKGPNANIAGYDGAVYIDLFAGPGLVKIEETGDVIVGSPIAVATSSTPFDYSFFVEIDSERGKALGERMSKVLTKDKYEIIPEDCNLAIDYIVQEIKKRFRKPVVFAFIDPEGMEIKWRTVCAISSAFRSSDFMINVSSGAARVAGRMKSKNSSKFHDRPIFEDFFQNEKAEDILLRLNAGQKVNDIYEQAVRGTLGRPRGKTIPIRDRGGSVMYNILAYTRESARGSRWANTFFTLEQELKGMDSDEVRHILDVLQKRAGTLDFSLASPQESAQPATSPARGLL